MKRKKGAPIHSIRVRDDIWQEVLKDRGTKEWGEYLKGLLEQKRGVLHPEAGVLHPLKTEKPRVAGVQEIVAVLYTINPTLKFENKTQRSAAERLIQKLGKEKAIRTAEAAVAAYGRKYAPVITTPIQLENKLSELVSFYKKNQSHQIIEV